jgi:hypothetical protein
VKRDLREEESESVSLNVCEREDFLFDCQEVYYVFSTPLHNKIPSFSTPLQHKIRSIRK